MDEGRAPDTRARILAVAADLFVRQGYVETSLRQIATELGLTKTAVLYHFPAKDLLLMELAEPMLGAVEDILDTADSLPAEQGRWAVVEGILDVSLTHLRLLTIANAAWLARDPLFDRVVSINNRASAIIAGPDAGLPEQVRASAVLALLARPAVFHREYPPQDVRREVLAAAKHLLGDVGSPAAPQPVPAGRPIDHRRVMTTAKLAEARRLQSTGTHTIEDIAHEIGVSRATAYRHLMGSARHHSK